MHALSPPTIQLYQAPDGVAEAPADSYLHHPEWLASRETWRPFPSRRPVSLHEPYSLAWFLDIEERRYSRHGRWIPKLFEFNRHRGDQVLGLGSGLGTDWVQYARGGASVYYCSPKFDETMLVRRHFERYELPGKFATAPLEALPYADESMDVVCLSALASTIGQPMDSVIAEIFRVLRPGGKVLAAVPARHDVQYFESICFPWRRLAQQGANSEQNVYDGRSLKRHFARFGEIRLFKRHLRRSDIPHVWRWMLLPVLERLMGRYLILKGFKPLINSRTLAAAA